MNSKHLQTKGAISQGATIGIAIVAIIIIALVYWFFQSNAFTTNNGNQTATTTNNGSNSTNNSNSSSVTTTSTGGKVYTNIKNKYSIGFPADAQNNLANPDDVVFTFTNGTSSVAGTLRIAVGTDVTHLAYCLVVPQGATGVATTTVNGSKFLSYTIGGSASANSGTTYYRLLHKGAPYENACYDIQKAPQGSATLNTKLNGVLQTLTFI